MSNDLVADAPADETEDGFATSLEDHDPDAGPLGDNVEQSAGTGLFGDTINLANEIEKDGDAEAIAGDAVLVGFDLLGMVMDPLGSLAAAGVGWLIEHISFLHTALDKLAGDPEVIGAKAETWEKISMSLGQTADDLGPSLDRLMKSWEGTAAQNYQATAQGYHDSLKAAAAQANGAAKAMTSTGSAVGAERGMIRDLIAMFVGGLIAKALVAVALMWCTAGGSVAAFIADTVIEGGILAGKLASRIAKLAKKIGEVASKIAKQIPKLEKLAKKVSDSAEKLRKAAKRQSKSIGDSTKEMQDKNPQSGDKYHDFLNHKNGSLKNHLNHKDPGTFDHNGRSNKDGLGDKFDSNTASNKGAMAGVYFGQSFSNQDPPEDSDGDYQDAVDAARENAKPYTGEDSESKQ